MHWDHNELFRTIANIKPKNLKQGENKPDDTKPEETKPEDTKPEDTKPEDTKPKDIKAEDIFISISPRPRPAVKLVSLDMFSGCGGLSQGLHASGLTESRWAVECDAKAAEAYRMNFPKAKVYEMDVVDWFKNLQVL